MMNAHHTNTGRGTSGERTSHDVGAPTRACRSLKLAWTDPDTGEQLVMSMDGGDALLAALERDGFRLLESNPAPSNSVRDSEVAGRARDGVQTSTVVRIAHATRRPESKATPTSKRA